MGGGPLCGTHALVPDRDRSYGGHFVARARSIGIRTVLTPIATPQANGIAERLKRFMVQMEGTDDVPVQDPTAVAAAA